MSLVAPEEKVPPGILNHEPKPIMNATLYQSIGSKSFSAGMKEESTGERSLQDDTWWSYWDAKWIDHYNEEWIAFISEHSTRTSGTGEESDLPRVWNCPLD